MPAKDIDPVGSLRLVVHDAEEPTGLIRVTFTGLDGIERHGMALIPEELTDWKTVHAIQSAVRQLNHVLENGGTFEYRAS